MSFMSPSHLACASLSGCVVRLLCRCLVQRIVRRQFNAAAAAAKAVGSATVSHIVTFRDLKLRAQASTPSPLLPSKKHPRNSETSDGESEGGQAEDHIENDVREETRAAKRVKPSSSSASLQVSAAPLPQQCHQVAVVFNEVAARAFLMSVFVSLHFGLSA